jgi:hypothetical protein
MRFQRRRSHPQHLTSTQDATVCRCSKQSPMPDRCPCWLTTHRRRGALLQRQEHSCPSPPTRVPVRRTCLGTCSVQGRPRSRQRRECVFRDRRICSSPSAASTDARFSSEIGSSSSVAAWRRSRRMARERRRPCAVRASSTARRSAGSSLRSTRAALARRAARRVTTDAVTTRCGV